MMKIVHRTVMIVGICLLLVGGVAAQELSKAQKEVWQTLEAKWDAWQKNDVNKMLSYYDPQYRRWNSGRAKLDTLDELTKGFRAVKGFEKEVSVSFESIVIEVFGDAAIAHYITQEIVTLTDAAPTIGGKKYAAGEKVEVPIRWSEYLVKKKGKWRIVGGSRDGTCALSKLSPHVCKP